MSAIVDAIRAEREQLLAPIADRLAALAELERLACAFAGDGQQLRDVAVVIRGDADTAIEAVAAAPVAPRRRARSTSTGVGIDGLGDGALSLLQAIRANGAGWLAMGELVGLTQTPASTLKPRLKRLLERNLVEARGEMSQRRYRAANPETPDSGSDVVEPDASALAVAAVPEETPGAPAGTMTALTAGARRVLRSRILDHLGRRRLNEQSLADHLNADRDDVADIVGKLLIEDKLVLDPDGLYRNVA